MELDALKKTLVAMKTSDANMSVVVKGADDANYQNVIIILDALQQAEITNVGLATDGL
jgi:biopolymer transport protein ExbD